jgi:hypothetical protein
MSDETRPGGCLCGAVRYQAHWPPLATAICHCINCQKQSGSALSVIAVLPRDGLAVTGNLTVFEDKGESGLPVWRKFCATCGSPVISDTPGAEKQGIIFLKAGTLDNAHDLAPTLHYWTSSAQSWFTPPEGVMCLEKQ